MSSKRRISYHWRLFIPVVLSLWVIIIGMAWWQVHRVKQTRLNMVQDQLELIGERMVDIVDNDESPNALMHFVHHFYADSPDYDEITVAVYDRNSRQPLYQYGRRLNFRYADMSPSKHGMVYIRDDEGNKSAEQRCIYYTTTCKDNTQRIIVLLPVTRKISKAISKDTAHFWVIVIIIGLFATAMAYISTMYIGRNIAVMRQFAEKASSDELVDVDINDDSFPHDELGDISRQIMHIYRQRIAEMRRREKEHRVALHAIEEKSRIKRELTGNINHELKTPVGIIKGYLDTIAEDSDMPEEMKRQFILKARDNVNRLIELIRDVTAITKLESGDKLVNVSEVNFHDMVFTLANDIEQTNVLQGKMHFTYDIPLDCVVLANESLLDSCITNLLRNSINYSKGTECVLKYVGEDDDYYTFEFYDDGVGVPPEHLPHIFDRFYRINTGRARNAGGTGLGLAIVKVTIESFTGTITASNRAPSGLQYTFTLPKFKKNS